MKGTLTVDSYAGIPHSTMQDDTYNGMFIPKGTMVFANVWYVTACFARFQPSWRNHGRSCVLTLGCVGRWPWTHACTTILRPSSLNVSSLGCTVRPNSSRMRHSASVVGM